jgi:hypothetical protein
VGDAVLGIRLELARDGVQVDVTHLSGGTAELALVVPAPEGWHTTIEYLDWDRLEDVGGPRVVRSSDESEEEASHALWGRFAPLPPHWPGLGAADPKALLERLRRVGIAIEAAPPLEARACGLGFALRALFDVPVSERPPGTRRGPDGVGPTVLRLREDDGVEGLRTLMSLAERLALSH